MDRQQFIAELNQDLQYEFKSIVQYVCHVATVRGAEYQQTIHELETHLGQELQHALELARQIDFLGGVPTTEVPNVTPTRDAERALHEDLRLEELQLDRYRDRIDQATELDLPDVAERLGPILMQTQDHIRDLRAAVGRK
jgi:bacterioferritin